jgi:hypothetical protein
MILWLHLKHRLLCIEARIGAMQFAMPAWAQLVIAAASAISVVAFAFQRDLWAPFYEASDPDVNLIVQALMMNGGLPATLFDHPGYLTKLQIAAWLNVLDFLGLVPFSDVQTFFEGARSMGFGAAMTPLVVGIRVLCIVTALLIVLTFGVLAGHATGSRLCGLVCAGLLSTSTGLLIHACIVRTEALSTLCFMVAVASLVSMTEGRLRPAVGFSVMGFFCYAAVLAKVQIVFGVLALPMIAVYLLRLRSGAHETAPDSPVVLPVLVSIPFLLKTSMVWANQMQPDFAGNLHPVGGFPYFAVPIYLASSLLAMRFLAHVPLGSVVRYALFSLAGVSAAFYLHLIWYDERNISSVLFFFDHLVAFLPPEQQQDGVFYSLLHGLWSTVAGFADPRYVIRRPTHLTYYLLVISAGYAVWRDVALDGLKKAAPLVLLAIGLETIFRIRSSPDNVGFYASHYRLYVEFLLFLAVALVGAGALREQAPRGRALAVLLCSGMVAIGGIGSVVNHGLLGPRGMGVSIDLPPDAIYNDASSNNPVLLRFLNDECGTDCASYIVRGQ